MTASALRLPDSFLWGAATSAYQVEGNSVNSDLWTLEHAPESFLKELSGDACDSYHRWREDLDIVRDVGLNTYRFSIEWSRIEPSPGQVSRAALAHYRRMIEGCFERSLTPVVTIHHFTVPRWFHEAGGWTGVEGVAIFRRYVHSVLPILDGVEWACTINEPNMLSMMSAAFERSDRLDLTAGSMPAPDQAIADALITAHRVAREELASIPGLRTGWTVANQNIQALPGAEERIENLTWSREDQFLDAANGDDFVGVQAYSRVVIGPDGPVHDPEARMTLSGWEYYPEALEEAVRHTAERVDAPILVTENGIATADDEERQAYTHGALVGLGRAISDGIDVLGYLHWSLLDNYEFGSWTPTFGLVSVNRETFVRTAKPSAHWLGGIARSNTLPT